DLLQAMDSRDAVAHRDDRANLADVDGAGVVLDFLAQNTGYFVRSNLSHISFRLSVRTESAPQRLQLSAYAAVVYRRSDARHDAADQCGIHGEPHPQPLDRKAFQFRID